MRVRALDANGDWTFGAGQNNYKTGNAAVAQSIQTKCLSWLGDCFFAIQDGIDWGRFLATADLNGLQQALFARIANIPQVTSVLELSVNWNRTTRGVSISYQVNTIYTGVTPASATVQGTTNFLLTEGGSIITTEDGTPISI